MGVWKEKGGRYRVVGEIFFRFAVLFACSVRVDNAGQISSTTYYIFTDLQYLQQ